jgi:hypothetical protein
LFLPKYNALVIFICANSVMIFASFAPFLIGDKLIMFTRSLRRRVTLLIMALLLVATLITALATPKAVSAGGGPSDVCQINGYTLSQGYFSLLFLTKNGLTPDGTVVFPAGTILGHQINIFITTRFDVVHGGYVITSTFRVEGCAGNPVFTDGRINRYDAGQTVAIYCASGEEGGIFTLIPATPYWRLGLVVTAAEINKVPTHPAKNTLIKKKGLVSLYRLTSGELQINAPGINHMKEDYNFIFNDCGF